MARIQPPRPEEDFGGYAGFEGEGAGHGRRRKLARYGVPVAVAGLAAATIGLGTALATTGGGPSLPHLTAQQLLTKMATSKVATVSGSVSVTTDLGLPSALVGGMSGAAGTFGGAGADARGGHDGKAGSGAADPRAKLTELLAGSHTLRVAADGQDRERVSLVDSTSEYTVVHNGDQVWAYDSASNSVFHATAPAGTRPGAGEHAKGGGEDRTGLTPADAVAQALKAVGPTTSVTVDGTAEVAGQDAYQLVIKPKQSGSTVGAIRVAVDAANGAPLSFALDPAGGGKAVVDIAYTKVDFGRPAASDFTFTVPKGAHVTQAKPGESHGPAGLPGLSGPGGLPSLGGLAGESGHAGHAGARVIGQGWTAIAELKAPTGHAAGGKDDATGLLGSLGKPVSGSFGSGTVISTRLVNVLITRDGAVFAGAVTPDALVKAADSAAG